MSFALPVTAIVSASICPFSLHTLHTILYQNSSRMSSRPRSAAKTTGRSRKKTVVEHDSVAETPFTTLKERDERPAQKEPTALKANKFFGAAGAPVPAKKLLVPTGKLSVYS